MISIDFNRVRWFWLDLDDTVWNFESNSLKSLAEIYESHSLDRFFESVDCWRECYMRHNHALWEQYNIGGITRDFLMRERFTRPLIEAGCDSDTVEELCRKLHFDYLDRLGRYPDLVDGARELMEVLQSKGYKIGILSNGFKEVQYRKIESSHISHLVDWVVLSDDIGINKPDRRLYDHALVKAETTARESVIVGDNLSTDIAGGLNAGWQVIFYDRGKREVCSAPEISRISRLSELTSVVAEQLGPDDDSHSEL